MFNELINNENIKFYRVDFDSIPGTYTKLRTVFVQLFYIKSQPLLALFLSNY